MSKKSIAFVMGQMVLGGAERALINMLKFFDYNHYQVTLWICGKEPGNTDYIHKNVRIRHISSEFGFESGTDAAESVNKAVSPIEKIRQIKAKALAKANKSDDAKNMHYFSQSLPKLTPEQYDCVIAYRGWDASILRIAFHRLNAAKRIVWMHNDTFDTSFPFPDYYQKADKIFCVSKTIKQHMLEKYPRLDAKKLDVFYNIIDTEDIKAKAEQPCEIPMRHPALLSVGRLSWEKGFEMIPETAFLLRQRGHFFHWYIIGEGYKRRDIEPKIYEYQVEDYVSLLGAMDNPYPYFKNCDIFVQTSITEGYCITTAEAKVFCKPVVTTNLPVMYEQFVHQKNGLIAFEITAESIADEVGELLGSRELREQLSANLAEEGSENDNNLIRLYHFFERKA